MRQILAGTDGSESAERAVDLAAELALAMSARLILVTVGGGLPRDELQRIARAIDGEGEAFELVAAQTLQRAADRARRREVVQLEEHLEWGDPAEALLRTAQRLKVDLVVIGRRGRGRLAGLLLGSVSQKVVSLAPCAVTVVP
jgi:nucleotide-binding universal stress UspA family protein